MKTLYYPVQAGVNIQRCEINKNKPHQCSGLFQYQLTLREVAAIRAGKRKVMIAKFTCKHHENVKTVIHD